MKHEHIDALLSLYRLGRRIKFAAKHRSTDSMLTAAIFLELDGPGVTLSELGECLAMKPAAMSEQVSKLERQGLVAKKAGADKRSKLLTLTKTGKQGATAIREAMDVQSQALFAGMEAAEVIALGKLLGKVNA